MEYIILNNKKFRKFLLYSQIEEAVKCIARKIEFDYREAEPLFLVVMKGAMFFAADLIREVRLDSKIEFISAKSYGAKMETSGDVKLKSIEDNFEGSDLIIVEDIVDSGFTLKALMQYVEKFHPKSIHAAAILSKPTARKAEVNVTYIGIEIPENFVVGYGLDYAELGRNLKDIYILSED